MHLATVHHYYRCTHINTQIQFINKLNHKHSWLKTKSTNISTSQKKNFAIINAVTQQKSRSDCKTDMAMSVVQYRASDTCVSEVHRHGDSCKHSLQNSMCFRSTVPEKVRNRCPMGICVCVLSEEPTRWFWRRIWSMMGKAVSHQHPCVLISDDLSAVCIPHINTRVITVINQ